MHTIIELLDGALEIVELWNPTSPAQRSWKEDWLKEARQQIEDWVPQEVVSQGPVAAQKFLASLRVPGLVEQTSSPANLRISLLPQQTYIRNHNQSDIEVQVNLPPDYQLSVSPVSVPLRETSHDK